MSDIDGTKLECLLHLTRLIVGLSLAMVAGTLGLLYTKSELTTEARNNWWMFKHWAGGCPGYNSEAEPSGDGGRTSHFSHH